MRDPWFWAFIVVLVLWFLRACYRMAKDQRDLDKFFQDAQKWKPAVTPDTMTLVNLHLTLRRLIIDPTDQENWDAARKLLVGTDFEIL